jgi:hypothetical protein
MLLLLTLVVMLIAPTIGQAQISNYNVEEISSDGTTSPRPFTITNVQQKSSELWIWINANNINEVASLLNAGKFEAETSLGSESSTVNLSLWKQIICTDEEGAFTLTKNVRYPEPEDCPKNYIIASISYYFVTPVIIAGERDFGIGLEPDFLWLIERK